MIKHALIWSSLILVTGYSAPAIAEPVFSADEASRESFYSGRVVWGTNRDEDNDYGAWDCAGELYRSIYTPQVGYVLRVDPASGDVLAAEATWFSVPPGASCIWDDEPGSVWMTANLAATFNPATMTWQRASASGVPPVARGADAPRLIDGVWVIPLTKRVDQSDRWWHWLGRPEPWYNHPDWFAPLPVWISVPDSQHATLRVTLGDGSADFSIDTHAEPLPHADLDRDGAAGVADIFAFLGAWFGGRPVADWDRSGAINVPDIFAFLSEWFEGV